MFPTQQPYFFIVSIHISYPNQPQRLCFRVAEQYSIYILFLFQCLMWITEPFSMFLLCSTRICKLLGRLDYLGHSAQLQNEFGRCLLKMQHVKTRLHQLVLRSNHACHSLRVPNCYQLHNLLYLSWIAC